MSAAMASWSAAAPAGLEMVMAAKAMAKAIRMLIRSS
jgi:hypothetical protein